MYICMCPTDNPLHLNVLYVGILWRELIHIGYFIKIFLVFTISIIEIKEFAIVYIRLYRVTVQLNDTCTLKYVVQDWSLPEGVESLVSKSFLDI